MVEDGAFSHKIDYVTIFKEILNLEGHPNCIAGSKVTGILLNGWILPPKNGWSFSGEGSASAACAPGLFVYTTKTIINHNLGGVR